MQGEGPRGMEAVGGDGVGDSPNHAPVAEVRRDVVLGVEGDGLRRRCGQAHTTECGEAENVLPLTFREHMLWAAAVLAHRPPHPSPGHKSRAQHCQCCALDL